MSVMVINEENFKRIGKFMSLRRNDKEGLRKTLDSWHELNIRNYCKRYDHHGEKFKGLEFHAKDFNYYDIPIPAAVQVMSDLKGLLYNCIEYGSKIDPEALTKLKMEITAISLMDEYKATKQFEDDVAY